MELNVKKKIKYPFTRETEKAKWSPESVGGIDMAHTAVKHLKASGECPRLSTDVHNPGYTWRSCLSLPFSLTVTL